MGIDSFKSGDSESTGGDEQNQVEQESNEETEEESEEYSHRHNKLVAERMGDNKVTHFGVDTPHAPPAIEGENGETVWLEEITDSDEVVRIATACGYNNPESMNLVMKIIRTDFREYYLPLIGRNGNYEALVEDVEHRHLPDVSRYNEEVNYDGDIRDLDVGNISSSEPDDDREEVDWANMMGSENEDGEEDSEEFDLEGLEA